MLIRVGAEQPIFQFSREQTNTKLPVRVLLLLGSLDGGGAERVAVNLLNWCDPDLVDLRLGLLDRSGPFLADVAPHRVVGTPGRSHWRSPLQIAAMIRTVQPDVVMTFGMGLNLLTWLATRTLGKNRPHWICREDSNTDAEVAALPIGAMGKAIVRATVRAVYRSADCLLTVSQDMARQLHKRFQIDPQRLRVVHNPVDLDQIQLHAFLEPQGLPKRNFIIGAGRLVRQKGFDLLIDAFAKCPQASDLDLVILGYGPLEMQLRAQAARLGVADRVFFPGFQANPWAWFSRASLFVLSSRWEGFGNVITEAMACGVPVLVADCDFGPREQVTHARNGWIAPAHDADALCHAMGTLLASPELMTRLAFRGRARANDFDLYGIAAAYTELFVERAAQSEVIVEPKHAVPREALSLVPA